MNDWEREYRNALYGKKRELGLTNEDLKQPLRRNSATTISRLTNNPRELTIEQFERLNDALGIKYKIAFKA